MEESHPIPGDFQQMLDSEIAQRRVIESQINFGEVMSQLPAYNFSLAKIKQIYDSAVSQRLDVFEVSNLEKDLETISARQMETIEHLNEREMNIDVKLEQVKSTKKNLMSKIARKKQEILEIDKRKQLEKLAMRNRYSLSLNRRKIVLPILTNQDMVFNVRKLSESTDARRKEIELLKSARNTRYKPTATKEKLLTDLHEREREKVRIIEDSSIKTVAANNCSTAIQLLQDLRKQGHPPHEAYDQLLQGFLNHKNTSLDTSVEYDDPNLEMETEMKLNYLEKFNEQFDEAKYFEAAIQAAHSPNGFLRTYEIMQKFIQIPHIPADHKQPIQMYCEALFDSVPAFGSLPQDMSILYADVMLKQGCLDLLTQTISLNSLSPSNELGFLLYSYRSVYSICVSLADRIFRGVQNRFMVAGCLFESKRPIELINYIIREFRDDDFINFLCYEPNIEKALLLLEPHGNHGPVIDLPNLLLLYLRNEFAILSVQLFFAYFDKSDPFSFGNLILHDVNADIGIWEEITGSLYASGLTDLAERIFVSILSRYIIYKANELHQNVL